MNDVADTFSEAGLRNQTRARDTQSVGQFEIKFTDAIAFVEVLRADADLGAIEDNIVWLARTAGSATLDQITGRWNPNGDRIIPGWRSMYVEVSYLARGQLHKGSFYCGPALIEASTNDARTLRTATALLDMERRMQAAVGKASREYKLTIRGGGAMHLFDVGTPWQAHPDHPIEPVPELTCKHCGEEIYHSNEAWRHKSTGRTAATKAGVGRGSRPIQLFDHDAEPGEASE